MSTTLEPNNDLGLYPYSQFEQGKRLLEECLPKKLEQGHTYTFKKVGHRTFEMAQPVTLREITDDVLFDDKAQVMISDVTYEIEDDQSYTKGHYEVMELLTA